MSVVRSNRTAGKRHARPKHRLKIEVVTEPLASAKAAELKYVTDSTPGIRRQRSGKGFSFVAADGKPIRDSATLLRIRALALPPAWRDVWICPNADGHLQATGRDARGGKQYRYHARWRQARDEAKYTRMILFGQALPKIRKRVAEDMAQSELSRFKVLATIVRLLETTLIRVGNDEYAQSNHSYGLTTMRDQHVNISGARMRFSFRGKSGKYHTIDVQDRRIAKIVSRCRDLPGYELFQYIDEEGKQQDVTSTDVNAYLREISGEDFTAKDFRTWAGTVLAALALKELERFDS
jgi:DNA topoisomerase-1